MKVSTRYLAIMKIMDKYNVSRACAECLYGKGVR